MSTLPKFNVGDTVEWGEKNTKGKILSMQSGIARIEEYDEYHGKYGERRCTYIWLIPECQLRKVVGNTKSFGDLHSSVEACPM